MNPSIIIIQVIAMAILCPKSVLCVYDWNILGPRKDSFAQTWLNHVYVQILGPKNFDKPLPAAQKPAPPEQTPAD